MAETKAENTTAENSKAGNKKLKTVIIAVILVLAAVAVSVGVTVYVLSGQQDTATADEQADAAAVVPRPDPLQYFSFDKGFVTSIASAERTRHLQVFIALAYRDPAVEPALDTHAPLLRSRLLGLLGRGDFLALQSQAGREAIKADALKTVNDTLAEEGAPPVKQVLFTNFVLQ